jgi:hypothetical protein
MYDNFTEGVEGKKRSITGKWILTENCKMKDGNWA